MISRDGCIYQKALIVHIIIIYIFIIPNMISRDGCIYQKALIVRIFIIHIAMHRFLRSLYRNYVSSEWNIYQSIITQLHDMNQPRMLNFLRNIFTLYSWKGHNETPCYIFTRYGYMLWWIWMILKNYVYVCMCAMKYKCKNISDKIFEIILCCINSKKSMSS